MWIDSHCHLQLGDAEVAAEIEKAKAAGVEKMVCVGTDVETSRRAVEISQTHDEVYASIGLHPHDASRGIEGIGALAEELIEANRDTLIAIGECGLDYFYEHSEKKLQENAFAFQIDLAKRNGLSLIIHTRDAWDKTFEILRSVGAPSRTVVHCFTGGVAEMQIALDLGFYISFSGITTFKNATNVQEAARFCPLDRIVLETDSPFLTPVPHRGRPNGPSNVGIVGSFISELKKLRVEEFATSVRVNTEQLFNL